MKQSLLMRIGLFSFAAVLAMTPPAFADEPTVTLTQAELNAIANSVQAHVLSQQADAAAKDALAKVSAAFTPKPAPKDQAK